MQKYKIIFPSNINYSCICCGACCAKWQIPVSEEEAGRFNETNWRVSFEKAGMPEAEKAEGGVQEAREDMKIDIKKKDYLRFESELMYNIKMRSDGSCIFLKKDNTCFMHAEKGFDYKSFTCKSFPVKLLYLPGNVVQVNYSFFCPGVYESNDSAYNIEIIEKMIECDNDKTFASEKLEFDRGLEIEYTDMLAINHFISDFLFDKKNASHLNDINYTRDDELWNDYGSALNLDKRMAVALYVVFFLSKLALKLKEEHGEDYLIKFREEISNKTILKKLLEKCGDIYDKSVSKNYGRLVLMAFISLHQVGRKGITGVRKAFTILFNMLKCSTGLGGFKSPEDGFNFSFKRHSAVTLNIDDPEISAAIEKFTSHFIFRKRAFYSDGLLKEYQYLILFYALIKWYAKAFAAGRNDSRANAGDVKRAVALIEKGYSNHSLLLNVLETNKNYENIFKPLFENYSMIKTVIN